MAGEHVYTSPGITPRTNLYAEAKMLRYADRVRILDRFAKPYKMPKNKTDTVKWRRPVPFDEVTTPLAEGVTPAGSTFRYEDVEAQLQEYGDVSYFTNRIEDFSEDPVANDMMEQHGRNIGRTLEALDWGVLQGGTSVFYANSTARTNVNTAISLSKQRAVTRFLKAQKAMKFTQMLAPGPNYATIATEASFWAVGHTDLESDIRNLPGFLPVAQYTSQRSVMEYELGRVEDVRYCLSPDLDPILAGGSATLNGMVAADATNVDIYPIIYMGEEAWTEVALRGQGSVEPKMVPVNQLSIANPLGQRGSIGWRTYHVAAILNELWMARLECGATDL